MRHAKSADWLKQLQQKPRVDSLEALAIRFLFSLRLVAVHWRAKRDPVPELTAKLGSVPVAISALEMVETLTRIWPEPIQVSRMCCQCLTHDEMTLGKALEAASRRDRSAFNAQLVGLLPGQRIDLLWDQAVSLVAAEFAHQPKP